MSVSSIIAQEIVTNDFATISGNDWSSLEVYYSRMVTIRDTKGATVKAVAEALAEYSDLPVSASTFGKYMSQLGKVAAKVKAESWEDFAGHVIDMNEDRSGNGKAVVLNPRQIWEHFCGKPAKVAKPEAEATDADAEATDADAATEVPDSLERINLDAEGLAGLFGRLSAPEQSRFMALALGEMGADRAQIDAVKSALRSTRLYADA